MLNIPLSLRLTTGIVILMIVSMILGEVAGYHTKYLATIIIAITLLGVGLSLLIISRNHNHIDLASIAPTLLKPTLDALTEGIVLIDKNEHIIIANEAFSGIVGGPALKLTGVALSDFSWQHSSDQYGGLPWKIASQHGTRLTDWQIKLVNFKGETRLYAVDCTPAMDTNGKHSGTMITFDDVTRREEKSEKLEGMLGMLQKSRDEITRQNEVLQELATRDSLTNCLNRRSFYERYEGKFRSAEIEDHPMSCIMADIDLFKTINDRHGHALGDIVICRVAEALQQSLRVTDSVCRYGGEEFCIILPGIDLQHAVEMSERARINISRIKLDNSANRRNITITSSFGVASIEHQPEGFSELIDRADKALYYSKHAGRNRVTAWRPEVFNNVGIISGHAEQVYKESTGSDSGNPILANAEPTNDILTGLPNRKSFHSNIATKIQICINDQQSASIIILDLDKFKRINSTLGYTVGDELLRVVSQRIIDILRSSDAVARLSDAHAVTSIYRLGGDEFGILLAGMDGANSTAQILGRIIEAITAPVNIQKHDIHLSCSAGISVYPDDGDNSDTLLKNASTALYHAKLDDQIGYKFFNDALDKASLDKIKLEHDLLHAIENDEIEVFYQPKLDLSSGTINSVEALVRWRHPESGMISANEIISIAESTGMINMLGDKVLETACWQLKQWQQSGFEHLVLAVNLSALQFRKSDVFERISTTLEYTNVYAHHLELELTEGTILDDIDFTSSTLRALHCSGIRISIDDFGTGYSSLSHLKRFPIYAVKIDRSFIRNLATDTDNVSIVSAIITMAHTMGIKVVAEGVESKSQLDILKSLGCDEAQGFLFSPPVPHHEASKLIGEKLEALIRPVSEQKSAS